MAKRGTKLRPYRAELPAAAGEASLEALLEQAHAQAPLVQDRVYNKAGGVVLRGTKLERIDGGLFLRVCVSTPGGPASVVSNRLDVAESDIALHQPPNEADYLDGDAFALIVENHVVTCAAVARDNAIQEYCRKVIAQHVSPDIGSVINLKPAGSARIARQLDREGVTKVELQATTYKASSLRNQEGATNRQAFFGDLIGLISPLWTDDEGDEALAEDENLLVNIEIKVDHKQAQRNRRREDFGRAGRDKLVHFAQAIIEGDMEEDECFIIHTGRGAQIKGSEVRLSKNVYLAKNGKTFFDVDVSRALQDYYRLLTQEGMLQQ